MSTSTSTPGTLTPARIWYQSLTDPEVDAPYFARLRDYLQAAAGEGHEVQVFGLQPGVRSPNPLSELRCATQVVANALTASARVSTRS